MDNKIKDDKIKKKAVVSFHRLDSVFAFLTILLSYCFVRFVLWNITGFFTTFFYIIMTAACLIYLKRSKYQLNRYHILQCGLLILFSVVFSITANSIIKFLNFFFVTGLGIYWVYSVCSENNTVERFFVFAMLKAVVIKPLSDISQFPRVIIYSSKKSKIGRNIGLAFLGLMVTIPLTIIVALLLTSADKGVEDMLTFVFNNILVKGVKLIIQLMLAIPVAFYIFNMLYSNIRKVKKGTYTEEQYERGLEKFKVTPNIAVYAAVTPICILYILFVISQIQYFVSAFRGNLPEDYSYAGYARRGFFELCVIAVINLMVIFLINLLSKHKGKSKPILLKLYSTVISVFTLFIISTAISKMVMYIGQYGLTQLRIYTSWFMILLAIAFIFIIIKQYRYPFHFAKYMLLSFVVMFGVLCFSNIDRTIARYNIQMYQAGKIGDLDVRSICNTSDDGMLYVIQQDMDLEDDYLIYDKLDRYRNQPYSTYNLSSFQLKGLLENKYPDR